MTDDQRRPPANEIVEGGIWPSAVGRSADPPRPIVIQLPDGDPLQRTVEAGRRGEDQDVQTQWVVLGDEERQFILLAVALEPAHEQLPLLFDEQYDHAELAALARGGRVAVVPTPGTPAVGIELHLDLPLLARLHGGATWHAQRDWLGWEIEIRFRGGPGVALRCEGRLFPTDHAAESAAVSGREIVAPPAHVDAAGNLVVVRALANAIDGIWDACDDHVGVPFDIPLELVERIVTRELRRFGAGLSVEHVDAPTSR